MKTHAGLGKLAQGWRLNGSLLLHILKLHPPYNFPWFKKHIKAYLKFPFWIKTSEVTCSLYRLLHYLLSYFIITILSCNEKRTAHSNKEGHVLAAWKQVFLKRYIWWRLFALAWFSFNSLITRPAITAHIGVTTRGDIAATLGIFGKKYDRPPLNVSSVLTERLSTSDGWAPLPKIGFGVNSAVDEPSDGVWRSFLVSAVLSCAHMLKNPGIIYLFSLHGLIKRC